MKKFSLILLTSGLLLVTGCSEKDMAYYQDNPEAAKEKMQECKKALGEAKDEETAMQIINDKECNAADDALKAIRKAEREAEKAAVESKNKAILAAAEKDLMKEHGDLDWKGFQKVYKASECRSYIGFFGKISPKDAKCAAIKQRYDKLIGEAENSFANTSFNELIKKEKEFCSLDKGRLSPCSVWQGSLKKSAKNSFKDTSYETLFTEKNNYCEIKSEFNYYFCNAYNEILEEKMKVVIDRYAQDDQLFTDEYNKCYEKSLTIKPKNYKKGGRILAEEDAICLAVNQAVRVRGLYNQYNAFKAPLSQ